MVITSWFPNGDHLGFLNFHTKWFLDNFWESLVAFAKILKSWCGKNPPLHVPSVYIGLLHNQNLEQFIWPFALVLIGKGSKHGLARASPWIDIILKLSLMSLLYTQGVMKIRKRVTLMVITVSVIFGVCWLTDSISYCLGYYTPTHTLEDVTYATTIMIMLNSAINPIVYALGESTIQREDKRYDVLYLRPHKQNLRCKRISSSKDGSHQQPYQPIRNWNNRLTLKSVKPFGWHFSRSLFVKTF